MERNHIIGFVLIFGLLVVWIFFNQPSKDQMAAMKHRQDSLNHAVVLQDSIAAAKITGVKDTVKVDSTALAYKFGSFAGAAAGTNQSIHLEDDFFKIDFDSKGGKITNVELKSYKKVMLD
ncbi:MAG TPA: hypothetical protein VJ508_18970, partial [Saprospiraceae bacterium]|nr:hypothetical protein [Saprospiraceae bacterium]